MRNDDTQHAPSSGTDGSVDVRDRRVAPRVRVLQKGSILYLDDTSTVSCVVLDRSATGARLRPIDVLSCPDRFRLRMVDSVVRLCEVVWRDGRKVGVHFLDQAPQSLPA